MKPSTKQIETHPIEDTNGMFSVTSMDFLTIAAICSSILPPNSLSPVRKDLVWRQVIIQQTEKRNTIRGIHAQAHPFVESNYSLLYEEKCFGSVLTYVRILLVLENGIILCWMPLQM